MSFLRALWERLFPEPEEIVFEVDVTTQNIGDVELYRIGVEDPGVAWVSAHPEAHATGEFPRYSDDGRCFICEGWGCSACNNSGGY